VDASGPSQDRLAIREAADRYARAVDGRDYALLDSLFTGDAHLAIYSGEPGSRTLRHEMHGREAIVEALRGIERYDRTRHRVGSQRARVEGDTATAETWCLAHHIHEVEGVVVDRTLAIRYRDRLVREGDGWRFAERILVVDWESERPLRAGN
jgi:hypothetical protein